MATDTKCANYLSGTKDVCGHPRSEHRLDLSPGCFAVVDGVVCNCPEFLASDASRGEKAETRAAAAAAEQPPTGTAAAAPAAKR